MNHHADSSVAVAWDQKNGSTAIKDPTDRGARTEMGGAKHITKSVPMTRAGEPRPSRNKERTSYSDFYKLGITKSVTTAPAVTPVEKKRSGVMKFKVKGPAEENSVALPKVAVKLEQEDISISRTAEAQALPIISTLMSGKSDAAETSNSAKAAKGSRERVMTSPLSSVPSDLDDEDRSSVGLDGLYVGAQHRKQVGSGTRGRAENATARDSSTGLLLERKRVAPSSDSGTGEKKGRKSKKIKISSPMKQRMSSPVDLGILPQELKCKIKSGADSRIRTRDDDQGSNDGHCSACLGSGKLLCCDDCPRSFHFTCIDPPIEEADIPDEPYFCMSCYDKRYGFPRPGPGLFQELLTLEVTRDPLIFQLPEAIRTFFEDVSTGELGVYQETKDQKFLRKDRNGFAEDIDPYRLRDRQNKPVICYRCGKSALESTGIVSCDHCTSHWHFDCVDPPLQGRPASYKKWMCPLHASDLTPPTRRPKNARLLDVSLQRGFVNDGNIEVLVSDEEKDMASESDTDSDGEDHSSEQPATADLPRLKYRLPARGIILDFLDTCNRQVGHELEGSKLLDAITPRDPGLDLGMLVDIATAEIKNLGRPQSSFDQEERMQLLALKALLGSKGKEKLLRFLESTEV